jgi:Protein of unknown function (DUF2442)
MEKIIKTTPLDNFTVEVLTASGLSGVFDVKPYLAGAAFKPLMQPAFFKLVSPMKYGITWPGEIDLSSDTVVLSMEKILKVPTFIKRKAVG